LHNVAREMLTPAAAAQVFAALARAGFPPVNFQPNLERDSVTAKFTGTPGQVPQLIEFLRATSAALKLLDAAEGIFRCAPRRTDDCW